METSINETETDQSFRSPPTRRQSKIFEQRVSYTMSENISPNKNASEVNESQTEDLNRYYQKLLAEKEMWKKEVTERRNKYHDLKLIYEMAAKAPTRSRISYSALSNEDIEFLKGKPNISKLVESQKKLHESVLETRDLYTKLINLEDQILKKCEDLVNMVTDYIFENSTVEPVE